MFSYLNLVCSIFFLNMRQSYKRRSRLRFFTVLCKRGYLQSGCLVVFSLNDFAISFYVFCIMQEYKLYLLAPLLCNSSNFNINISTSFRISKRSDLSSDSRTLTAVTSLLDASSSKLYVDFPKSNDGKSVKPKTNLRSMSIVLSV